MSLFVGNLSRNVTQDQLKDLFNEHGPCKIQLKRKYAFIEYDNTDDAEKAKEKH